jgi:hypothetical protein
MPGAFSCHLCTVFVSELNINTCICEYHFVRVIVQAPTQKLWCTHTQEAT